MAYPKYSIVINVVNSTGVATATAYTDKATALDAYRTAQATSGHSAYLYLQAAPTESSVPTTVTGSFTDAYGVSHSLPLAN